MIGRIARLGLLVALVPAVAAAKDFEQRLAVEPGGRLRVELPGGAVVVESHDADEVRVDALAAGVGATRLDFELSRQGSEVRLEGQRSGWLSSLLSRTHVRVRVRVPHEFAVDVHTAGGDIEVDDLEGDVRARTSGGRITLGHIEGDVDAETSGGAIEVGEIEGDLRVRTSGGPIRIFEVEGAVDARTSGGSIEILGVGGDVDARTSGGSISVRFDEAPGGRIETSGGGIDVEYPDGEGADLDAQTSGGQVEIDAAIPVRGDVAGSRVRARLGDGGRSLRLRTSGGDIGIRVR